MYSSYSPASNNPVLIPIQTPSDETSTLIPVHFPPSYLAKSAVKIQAAYRGHLVRSLVRMIRSVDSEARRLERLIQRQDTVDAIRDENGVERLRLNEMLMKSLLRLDSVPGYYPAVRELRRRLSRRIVGLQELLDWIVSSNMSECETHLDGIIPSSLEEIFSRVWKGKSKWIS